MNALGGGLDELIKAAGDKGLEVEGLPKGMAARIDVERMNVTHETTIVAAPPAANSREP